MGSGLTAPRHHHLRFVPVAPAAIQNIVSGVKSNVAGKYDSLAVELHHIDHRIDGVSRNEEGPNA